MVQRGLAVSVRAVRHDWQGLTATESKIRCERALLSDECNWALQCSAAFPGWTLTATLVPCRPLHSLSYKCPPLTP